MSAFAYRNGELFAENVADYRATVTRCGPDDVGALVALQERAASGKGQWVQTSLLEAQIAMMDFQAARFLVEGSVPPQADRVPAATALRPATSPSKPTMVRSRGTSRPWRWATAMAAASSASGPARPSRSASSRAITAAASWSSSTSRPRSVSIWPSAA